jgi:hypothetical protein
MDRRANPTPLEQLVELDRQIALRTGQQAELQKLRRLLVAQLFLFERVGRRETDKGAADLAPVARSKA